MIKIAHTVTAYQSVVSILDSKMRGLAKYKDFDVSIISSLPPEPDSRTPAVRHIPVEIVRVINPIADLKSIWKMYRIFCREKYDIVHSHTAKAGFITAIAAKMAGIKRVYHTSHGLPFFEGQPEKQYKKYKSLEKLACRFRDHLFTQNNKDYDSCVELMNGDSSKVSVEGNGVDIDFVNELAKKHVERVKPLYPDNNGIKIAMLCRYEPVKRIPDFFKVIEKLTASGVMVSAVVTGMGPLENELSNKLSNMIIKDNVCITGYCEYPHTVLDLADIVVLCSEKEGIPRVLMEAMALRKPVVATDVLGTQELVLDGQTGFLAPLGDVDKLAERVKELAESVELRRQLGNAGYERVVESYNDVKIAAYLHDFYIKAMS